MCKGHLLFRQLETTLLGLLPTSTTVYESYFAVKAITEDGTERLWTYNLVFGESREWIGEEIITKVIPDGKYLQFDITDINTSIMWSGTEEADTQDASANMVTEIQFPMTVTEIIVQDVGCFGGDFYYQLQENGSWNDSWIEYKDVDVIRVPEGIRLENPYFAIKGVAENGEEKMWTFDLTESIGKEKISAFAKEGDGSMFISDVLDDGSIIIQMILFQAECGKTADFS